MGKVKRQVLHHCFSQAKDQYKMGNTNSSRNWCDRGIAFVAEKRIEGYKDNDEIEDVRVELWLERFWMFLQNKDLLL